MPKYKVLRPIEYNQKLYVPSTALSAGSGAEIQVDASGVIQLSDQEASQFALGQIEPARDETAADMTDTSTTGSSRKTKT
jgi:hypothetical protein